MGMTYLDRSADYFMVLCRGCDWSGFALDREEGWERAARHERSVHPGEQGAEITLHMLRKRRNVNTPA